MENNKQKIIHIIVPTTTEKECLIRPSFTCAYRSRYFYHIFRYLHLIPPMRDHLDYGMLRLDGITEILRNNHQHITATITHQRADLIVLRIGAPKTGMSRDTSCNNPCWQWYMRILHRVHPARLHFLYQTPVPYLSIMILLRALAFSRQRVWPIQTPGPRHHRSRSRYTTGWLFSPTS